MGASAETAGASAPAWTAENEGGAAPRALSASARRVFLIWTALFWGGVGVLGALFFVDALDFPASTKLSLYGISIWLNGWLLALWTGRREGRSKPDLYHDCLVIWMVSYAMTNVLWEIPWVIFSPFIFSFAEVFGGFENMTGGVADTLLALVWTQYQYFVFPLIFGFWGFQLLRGDLRRCDPREAVAA
jgi:hypothetical protein